MEPKWPSQFWEFIPKLKNHCKFDILTKKQVFLLYSSVYYRYRLNRKESLNFALFSMKIFMIIHISCGLPQNYYNISTKYPPLPQTPKKCFFSQIATIISSIFLTFLSHNLLYFYPKMPKKSSFLQIAHIILDTFLTLLRENLSNWSKFLTFRSKSYTWLKFAWAAVCVTLSK